MNSTASAGTPAVPRGRNFDVRDRVVVITGAGQGIGREYALQFAAAGAVPVVAEVNAQSAARVAKEITDAGYRAMAAATDVSDPASVQNLVDGVMEKYGRVDVLVNNAAIFTSLKMKPFEQIPRLAR